MAVQLPNGVTLAIHTALAAALTVSQVTNANPAVATSTAHGLQNGDIGIVSSGWSKLDSRVVRVAGVTANTFQLENIDTSSTALYPAGSGIGTFTKINTFQQIQQLLECTTSGGDMQFTSYSFLENDFETQMPTQASPMTLTLKIADDPTLAGYQAIKAAADARAIRALKLTFPNNTSAYYYGYVSFNETPTLTKNQVNAVTATFNLLSRPVRYAT